MYQITKSVDIDFAHHVSGHMGKCINIHGHTWKFEVTLQAKELDCNGFVVDFGELKKKVFEPIKELFDHSFVISEDTLEPIKKELMIVGRSLIASRPGIDVTHIPIDEPIVLLHHNGCTQWNCGGITVTTFKFTPTSERIARWLYETSVKAFKGTRVEIFEARVYEQLHPVEAYASYKGD